MSEGTSYVFGIDLGTTYSCISYLKDGHPVVCQSLEGENTTPSVIRMPCRHQRSRLFSSFVPQ